MSILTKPTSSVMVEVGPVDNPLQPTIIEPSLQQKGKSQSTHTNFIQYAQTTWKVAVKYLLPSYLYVLIAIGPCLAVLGPYVYFGLKKYNIDFKGTIDDLSYEDRWQVSALNGFGVFLGACTIIMIRNVILWEQPVDDVAARNRYYWISTIIVVIIGILGMILNVLRFFGHDLTPLGDLVTLCSTCSCFWCVHMVTRHNEGAKPKHSIFAAIVVMVDLSYGVMVTNLADFYQSTYFTWTSPFIFSATAIFSRKVAEVSTYPVSTAARVCTASLVLNQTFVRGNHTAYLNNVGLMIGFEFFYSFVSILTKITIYYRHALIHKLTAGECKLVVKTTARGHYISTDMNVVDSVFECGTFVICSCLRQLVSPVSWDVWVFLVVFCLVVQFWNNLLSLLISGYIEGIQFDVIVLQQHYDWKSFKRDTYYYVVTLVAAICFLLGMLMNLWDPNSRSVNL